MLRKFSLLLFCFSIFITSAQSFSIDGVDYNVISGTQNVEVVGNSSYSGDLTIPSNVGNGGINYNVTSIGDSAFSGSFTLTSVIIPNTVTIIKDFAFYHSGITSVTIPSSVTSIGINVFSNTPLSSVTISNSLTSIGEGTFSGCSNLSSVTLPDSLTAIGPYVFSDCSSLTSISIPNSVTTIGDYAFYNCTGLTSIKIPSSVTSIGDYSFFGCSGLTSIICEIIAPVTINANVFTGVNKSTCTLSVPSASVSAYQAADVWKNFTNIIAESTLSITERGIKNNIILYPNPVHNEAILEIKNSENANLEVYDMNGKLVLRKSLNNNYKNTINTSNLPKGVYLFKTIFGKNSSVKKVIKN